uniref:Uncharacterized protein n=1 Tax=Anguilla anguilla TaxID=7936 RepID=A0A0E9SJ07_ANGAN
MVDFPFDSVCEETVLGTNLAGTLQSVQSRNVCDTALETIDKTNKLQSDNVCVF